MRAFLCSIAASLSCCTLILAGDADRIAKDINAAGGYVSGVENGRTIVSLDPKKAKVDQVIKHLAGIKRLGLSVYDGPIGEEDARRLAELPGLESLSLNLNATPFKLSPLGKNTTLSTLYLRGRADSDFRDLAALSDLQELRLSGEGISDNIMPTVGGLKKLRELSLHEPLPKKKITDEGVKSLSGLKNLEILELESTGVTDQCLATIGNLSTLTHLNVSNTKIAGSGMKHLLKLKNLKTLRLIQTPLGDEGVQEIARIDSLRNLSIASTNVTDVGLKEIAAMSGLEYLFIGRNTRATEKGITELRKALPKCKVDNP